MQLIYVSNNTFVWLSYDELTGDKQFAFICYAIYAAICIVTFVVLLIIMIRVIRKVGSSDKIIPLMLAMLQLSALSCSIFFIDQCRTLRQVPKTEEDLVEPNSCEAAIFTTLQTAFLALAVILNINKWIYFTLRI
mmetsp:Transcript_12932/g.17406  ORF Transcript_12932/g.17406 Transcript_12932/m.17406 type:complete len:135 (+) Transcript_12932:124-528(+)